jgi:hypothetical protein
MSGFPTTARSNALVCSTRKVVNTYFLYKKTNGLHQTQILTHKASKPIMGTYFNTSNILDQLNRCQLAPKNNTLMAVIVAAGGTYCTCTSMNEIDAHHA